MRILFILICLLFVGCGGGGSSSNPGTTPPPPSGGSGNPKTPPTITYKLNSSVVFEEGYIIIDAEDSTGGSSSIDTIDVIQRTGAESKRLSNLNRLHWLFLAPNYNVDGEQNISFEITATNYDGLTTTKTFDVTVIGRSGPGTIVGEYNPPLELLVGTGRSTSTRMSHETVIAKRQASESFNADKEELIFPGWIYPETEFNQEHIIRSEELFNDVSFIERGNLGLFSVFANSLSILNQVDNRLDWLVLDDQNITDDGQDLRKYRLMDSIDIQSPCFVAPIVSLPQDYVLIGQKNLGFSAVNLNEVSNAEGLTREFDSEIDYSFGEGHSFCHFLQTRLADHIAPWNVEGRVALPSLIAVDYDSNDLVLVADRDALGEYEIIDKLPLDTGTDKTLKIVRVYSRGSPSRWPRWMVILLADDTHDGDHRLMLVTQDFPSGEILQTRIELGDGIPSDLLIGNYGGKRAGDQFAEDLVVIRSSSPTALYFDDIGTNTVTTADNPIYAEAVEFEIGEGAGTAVSVEHRAILTALEQILVSYPETGELRLFTVDPENDPEIDPYQ